MQTILSNFRVTEDEYAQLDAKFGSLAHYAAWQLKKKNTKNNHTDEQDDIVQDLRIALLRAGSYYKRQTYIEDCFDVLSKYVKDKFMKRVLKTLMKLWVDRKRHGANRQKFGEFQEILLDRLIDKHVPKELQPSKDRTLKIDSHFATYCKQIVWNETKSSGKKITREKSWRTGLVSLSEFDYLGSEM